MQHTITLHRRVKTRRPRLLLDGRHTLRGEPAGLRSIETVVSFLFGACDALLIPQQRQQEQRLLRLAGLRQGRCDGQLRIERCRSGIRAANTRQAPRHTGAAQRDSRHALAPDRPSGCRSRQHLVDRLVHVGCSRLPRTAGEHGRSGAEPRRCGPRSQAAQPYSSDYRGCAQYPGLQDKTPGLRPVCCAGMRSGRGHPTPAPCHSGSRWPETAPGSPGNIVAPHHTAPGAAPWPPGNSKQTRAPPAPVATEASPDRDEGACQPENGRQAER